MCPFQQPSCRLRMRSFDRSVTVPDAIGACRLCRRTCRDDRCMCFWAPLSHVGTLRGDGVADRDIAFSSLRSRVRRRCSGGRAHLPQQLGRLMPGRMRRALVTSIRRARDWTAALSLVLAVDGPPEGDTGDIFGRPWFRWRRVFDVNLGRPEKQRPDSPPAEFRTRLKEP